MNDHKPRTAGFVVPWIRMTHADIIMVSSDIVGLFLLWAVWSTGWLSWRAGAPFVPMSRKLVRPLLAFADLRPGAVVYDLGCGDGRVLTTAVRDFGVVKAVGYEIARWPFLLGRWRIKRQGLQDRISILHANARTADVSDADFIYMYLLAPLTNILATYIASQVRTGTKVLCPSFPIDLAAHPEFRLTKKDRIQGFTVYLYERA